MLTGCNTEDGIEGTFTPPTQEQLTQNAYADNESTGSGFSFTTNAPWTATVTEVDPQVNDSVSVQAKSVTRAADNNGNNVVWLKLYNGNSEAYSGEAGTFTLRIEIDQNYTGERREATITISSGSNTFTVTVVQEGTKQDGSQNEPPVKVTKIILDKTELSLDAGAKTTLTATVEPADATIKSVVWSSSDPAIASVNPVTGEITAIAYGTATVTATSSSNKDVSASCAVTVEDGNDEPLISEHYLIKKIVRTVTYWDEIPASQRDERVVLYNFEYNGPYVSSYTIDIIPTNNPENSIQLSSSIDYSASDRLRIEDRWSDTGTQTYDVLLNDSGYIRQGKSQPYPHAQGKDVFYTYEIEYNNENRISRVAYSDTICTYTYKDGVLSGGSYTEGDQTDFSSGLEQYFNQTLDYEPNLDINMLFFSNSMLLEGNEAADGDVPGRLGRLALMRLAGRGMDRYITSLPRWRDDDKISFGMSGGYPEPNVTILLESFESYDYVEDTDSRLDYVLDSDGMVASVTIHATVAKTRCDFYIVVGNELVDPEYPEAGYRYESKSEVTELDRGTNLFVYSFGY